MHLQVPDGGPARLACCAVHLRRGLAALHAVLLCVFKPASACLWLHTCHRNAVRHGIAQTKPHTKPQTKPFGFTAVQPKASTSWFKAAKKHCMQCGTASTKVDRPKCKSCGSTFWKLQAVAASEVHYLDKTYSYYVSIREQSITNFNGDGVNTHRLKNVV